MRNILKIIQIAKPLHWLIILIGFLILVQSAIELVAPILTKYIVDDIVAEISGKHGNAEHLALLVAISFGAGIVGIIFASISNRLGDHLAGELRKFLTEKFYDKVLALPQSYFDSEISGKIVNQLNRGIVTIQGLLNSWTNFILPLFLQSIFTIFVMARFNAAIAFFTFLLFPIYMALSYVSAKKWGVREVEKNAIEDYTRGRITEVISNIKLVKSFSNETGEYKTVSSNLVKLNQIYAQQSKAFHIYDFVRNLSLQVILLIVNVIVFYSAFVGKMTIGDMVLILTLFTQARRPLFAMSFILSNIQTAESGSKEFFEILELPSSENYTRSEKLVKLKDPTIEFRKVSFKYEKSEMVLQDVSFLIKNREKVALVGHSGVGKSTIVNLILKFYEPTSGDISLKGQRYKNLTHNFIRNNIALVFQENELFSSTIYENVAYGNLKATKEAVIEALRKANAWDFVKKLPKGIESEVGERGVRLSGGQKQRIQVARAILKDSPILILDEATSSLDAKSEREVQNALENLMKNRLVIIIAHRFSTIQNVDKILVIDQGKIVDSGDPRSLAKKSGIYSDLLKYQIEGNRKLLQKFEIY
ncbi:ABC transporter ATP-binding protein [Candidatus Curtissbacteria bacterium]|nr:ABC transporter ATP-binding protein [Candidatus Curtissbacteria bacterium]